MSPRTPHSRARSTPGPVTAALTRLASRVGSPPPGPAGASAEAMALMRSGRLMEATALLQRSMGPAGASTPAASTPASTPTGATPDGGTVTRASFTGAAGTLAYRLYAPSRPRPAAPLIVMLHGGTQDADVFAASTGMDAIAEREGFLVVYPEQSRSANAMGYWNWFRPGDQRRDAGEPALLAGITRAVLADRDVDPARVGVAGFSAGAAMAAVLAATYPDLYAGAMVHSGLAHAAARDVGSAFSAMSRGSRVTPGSAGPVPLFVVHGDADRTVAPVNAEGVVSSAVGADAPSTEVSGREPGGRAWTRRRWTAPDGRVRAEALIVHGGGHDWSGGRAGVAYSDPSGPDAGEMFVAFLGAGR